jgi:hypothetical protein
MGSSLGAGLEHPTNTSKTDTATVPVKARGQKARVKYIIGKIQKKWEAQQATQSEVKLMTRKLLIYKL